MIADTLRVTSLAELDALVGHHVTQEKPEVYWEDTHGYFQFHSEFEARRALNDPYFQRFLPHIDWTALQIREVRVYRCYSVDPTANWILVEKAVGQFGAMLVWREVGRWHAAFGSKPDAEARTATIAICLAALRAAGVPFELDHNRIDSQLAQYESGPPGSVPIRPPRRFPTG